MPLESVQIVIGDDHDSSTGRIGQYFGYWGEIELKRSIDTYSSVSFSAPFEPNRREFRETFRPFSFKRLEVLINVQTMLTGFLLDVDPPVEPDAKRVSVTGYGKPAVFHDCCAPASSLPFQFDGQQLPAIASLLGAAFGVGVEYEGDAGTPFKRCKLEVEGKIQDFLVDLAKQRKRLLTDTREGQLRCWQSVEPGNPVGKLIEGVHPFGKLTPTLRPQECFSEVTGHGKKKRSGTPGGWTAYNRFLERGPLRPSTIKLEDTDPADVTEGTLAALGRMLANMASWTIPDIPGWRAPNGEIWEPNTTLVVRAPSGMIYSEYELLIRDVTLKQSPQVESATLDVVLPGAFSGRLPDSLPWDEPP